MTVGAELLSQISVPRFIIVLALVLVSRSLVAAAEPPEWRAQVALPILGGVDADQRLNAGLRPEIIAARVTTGDGLHGWGVGVYGDFRRRRSESLLVGGGLTVVSYSGIYAVAPSLGCYKLGDEHGVSASVAMGFRGWYDDALGERLGADIPFGLRLDVRDAIDGSRTISGVLSVEFDASLLAAPFVAIHAISQLHYD